MDIDGPNLIDINGQVISTQRDFRLAPAQTILTRIDHSTATANSTLSVVPPGIGDSTRIQVAAPSRRINRHFDWTQGRFLVFDYGPAWCLAL